MNFSSNITSNEDKESFLKTRVDSLELPLDIFNALIQNNIRTVRGLINKTDLEIKTEFGLRNSELDLIAGSLSELSIKIILESRKREVGFQRPPSKLEDQKEIDNIVSDNLHSRGYEEIAISFARHFGIDEDVLIGQSRKKEIVRMRDIMVYVLREYGNLSFPVIAKIIGNRDHTAVIHSFRKMEKIKNSFKDFEDEFNDLIIESKKIKERKDQIEKLLIDQLSLSLEKIEQHKIKTLTQVDVPERNLQILELYRQGLTLENIGKIHLVTRERVRQIIVRTIKQIAFNESISIGVKVDFEKQLSEEKKIRNDAVNNNKPVKEAKKYVRKYKWSMYYESCKMCGTIDVPHFKTGLCEECGNKSITGEAREKIIEQHGYKCDLCDTSRDKVIEQYKKDFYLSRKVKSVLCRKCFLETTGKALGGIKKNKWRMFYN